jgi:hypothetical protein
MSNQIRDTNLGPTRLKDSRHVISEVIRDGTRVAAPPENHPTQRFHHRTGSLQGTLADSRPQGG